MWMIHDKDTDATLGMAGGWPWRSATTTTPPSSRKGSHLTDTVTKAAEVLKEHRASIDRLDAILVYTLGERFKHTQAVGKLKAEHDLPPSDPAREATQIERLEDLAKRADLDPDFAKSFLSFIIREVIQNHKKFQ